jgi:hypothetical protein
LKVNYLIRVKGGVKTFYRGHGVKLNTVRFEGNARQRNLGRRYSGRVESWRADVRVRWPIHRFQLMSSR